MDDILVGVGMGGLLWAAVIFYLLWSTRRKD